MLEWIFGASQARQPRRDGSLARHRLFLESLEDRTLLATSFTQTNLISDVAGLAQFTDPNLRNPWGVAVASTGDFWVANAGSDTITLYKGDVNGSAVSRDTPIIKTPIDPRNNQVAPTGLVLNSTRDFNVAFPGYSGPASYFIAGLDGTITAIAPTFAITTYTTAAAYQAQVVAAIPNAVYTGLALGNNASGNFLYAANAAAGRIDVFNDTFQLVSVPGAFADSTLPAGFAPFNVANINGTLFVAYKSTATPDAGGVIDTFDTTGNFLSRFAAGSNLNAPWAVVQAPSGFGSYGNDILVGNFGDGHISAYDTSGNYLGQLTGQTGQPIAIERLWQLTFGNGTTAGNSSTLYFSSGLNAEKDGLFGSLTAVQPSQPLFVTQVYADLLHRAPDAGGLAYWNGLLSRGATRQDVVSGIENSGEFRGVEVTNLYEQLLHRAPDTTGLNFWSIQLAAGKTVEQVAAGIAGSAEFFQTQGGGTDAGFLTALYQDALGRAVDASGQAFFTPKLQSGVTTAQVAAAVFASQEFKTDQVQSYYLAFLSRPADASGLQFWVATMLNGTRDEQVVMGIMASDELFSKLGQLPLNTTPQPGSSATPTGTGSGGILWY
jgi:uncharacterized protein (TIGR03118 family)